MAKKLRIRFPEKCIGCELCVFAVQRQLNKVGLDESPIRIFKNTEDSIFGNTNYVIEMDVSVDNLNLKEIVNICPTGVFEIEESTDNKPALIE